MKTILIANPKGGSGKTTLSTNIAGHLASVGHRVMMLDMDRQKSSTQWLTNRSFELPFIDLLEDGGEAPADTDWLVIDSPAGLHGKNLEYALKLANIVVVPIAPSMFDIKASNEFLELLNHEKIVRKNKVFVGVVGMRMAPNTRAATKLAKFIAELDLPVLAYLRVTQVYVNAAFQGKTLFDLPRSVANRELEQWAFMLDWLKKNG